MPRMLLACALLVFAQPATGRYQFDAAGRAARIDQSWELLSGFDAIVILSGFARCGRQMFIGGYAFDVFRIDANQPSQRLVSFAGEARGIGRPSVLGADCARQRLYVVNSGPRTVAALDLASGEVVASRPYQRELYEPRSFTLLSSGVVQISGLWNQNTKRTMPERTETTFWEETSLGQRVSLDSGAITPGLVPYETRCIASGACLTSDVDAIGDAASRGWIASHATSTRVALYNADGARTSTFDVTSPKFVRDGTEVPMATKGAETFERWRGRNSVIRRVFSVGRYFAVIHSKTIHPPGWVFGQQSTFDVYMNIYGAGGTPLTSDVHLPDLPIGRDATHLYVIDYPQGRGESPDRVRLVRIPVEAGAAIVR